MTNGSYPRRNTIPGRIARWVVSRLGEPLLTDREERALRLVEEAIELAQAEGIPYAHIVNVAQRVYSRPAGEPAQEMGGVMVCAHAWAIAAEESLAALTEREVSRIEAVPAEVTRAKHDAKADAGTARRSEAP